MLIVQGCQLGDALFVLEEVVSTMACAISEALGFFCCTFMGLLILNCCDVLFGFDCRRIENRCTAAAAVISAAVAATFTSGMDSTIRHNTTDRFRLRM